MNAKNTDLTDNSLCGTEIAHGCADQTSPACTPCETRTTRESLLNLFRDNCGAVLLEYVLLGTVVLSALVFAGNTLFNPGGAVTGNFGLVGDSMMDWYHRIVDTVALPVP